MSARTRRVALALHLTVSVGWIGAAGAYLALAIAAAESDDSMLVRSAWAAMELIGWAVLIPLSIGTVLTGLVMAVGSRWGLFRHYWVVLSLTITLLATAVLAMHMPDVSDMAAQARVADAAELQTMGSDLFHSGLGLVVLLAVLVLNVFKPRGLTRYGWRKQQRPSSRLDDPPLR